MTEDLHPYINQLKQETDIFANAKLLHTLVREKNVRIVDLAKSLGKTSSYICHLLRLATLPDIIVDGYYSKLITISHLFILSRIKDEKKLLELYEQLLTGSFTVQKTEELIREALYKIHSVGKRLEKEEINKIVEQIRKTNSDLDITVIQTRIKGKVILEIKASLEKTSSVLKQLLEKLAQ